MQIKPSESNRSFDTGAQRGEDKGRGKPSLLPFNAMYTLLMCFKHVHEFPWLAIIELSKVYEGGARKYKPRNWESGIPAAAFVDSAHRHLQKFVRGDTDEPHCGQYVWNLMGLLATHLWVANGDLPESLFDPEFPPDAEPDPKYTGLQEVNWHQKPSGNLYNFVRGSASFHSSESWKCVCCYLQGFGVDQLVLGVAHALCLLEHVTEFYGGGEPVDIPKVQRPESLEITGPPTGGTYTVTNNATGETTPPIPASLTPEAAAHLVEKVLYPPEQSLSHLELAVLAKQAADEYPTIEQRLLDFFNSRADSSASFTADQIQDELYCEYGTEDIEAACTRLVRDGKLGVKPGTIGPIQYERRHCRTQCKGGHEKAVIA